MVELRINESNNSPLRSRKALSMVRTTTITSNALKGWNIDGPSQRQKVKHEEMSREGAVCETMTACSAIHGVVETGCVVRRAVGMLMH